MNTHTETKHTPGPWKIEETSADGAFVDVVGEDGWIVAEIEPNNPDVEANARLIAAAPDLLEALCALLEWCGIPDGHPAQPMRDKARAAIAKATEGAQ